jgi:hypothetical protein
VNRERDPELDALFEQDPGLRDVAAMLRSTPHDGAEPDPVFRANLRRRLMEEAWKMREPHLPWYRRLAAPPRLAWSGALVGILLIALAVAILGSNRGHSQTVMVHLQLDHPQNVALVKPVELQFSQPMDQQATNQAISVQPATELKYEWPSTTAVDISPRHGTLAPQTRYEITVGDGARTARGQPAGAARTFDFVTEPSQATPPPPVTPTPTPDTGGSLTLVGERKLGPIGSAPAAWSADGSQLYVIDPNGQLVAYAVAAGGAPQTIVQGGATLVAVGPGGPAYAQGGDIVYGSQPLKGANPSAIGFHGGRLVYVSGGTVLSADRTVHVQLAEQPAAAAFSPDGARLAYVGSSGLHLLDLSSGQDQRVPDTSALGAFSPDGAHYAFASAQYVGLTDNGATTTRPFSLAGVTGLSWSKDDQLLLTGPGGLLLQPVGGGAAAQLSSQAVSRPQWSPAADGTLSYVKGGAIFVARVSNGQQQQAANQEDVVNRFLAARQQGDAAGASSLLDAPGQAAFQLTPLIYGGGPGLSRYQVLLDQPDYMVVRLVVDQGTTERAIDESLTLTRDDQGRILIHDASDAPARDLGRGPEVVRVQVAAGQVTVTFDSDLDPSTVGAVTIAERRTTATYDRGSRAVVLALDRPLSQGSTYQLQISPFLHNYVGRSAVPLSLRLHGVSEGNPNPPGPNPTPSAGNQPRVIPTP